MGLPKTTFASFPESASIRHTRLEASSDSESVLANCETKPAHRLAGALKAKLLKILIVPLDAQTQAALLPYSSLKPSAGTVSAA
jgi:hypothetical protein